MHRSGTSLVASVVRAAGVDVGSDLLGPDEGNRRGHFEDRDFVRLHEEMLVAGRETWLSGRPCVMAELPPVLVERARSLVAARSALEQWAWKDPRTLLFLDLWHTILPEPRYLFVYRHPVDVVLSLARRGAELCGNPWLSLRAWTTHNHELLRFVARHPGRCYLAAVPALTADLDRFVARAAAKLGLTVGAEGVSDLFHPAELSAPAAEPEAGWDRLMPQAVALYRELDAVADLPAAEAGRWAGRRSTLDARRIRGAAAELRRELARASPASSAASA
jgi:hypothetical protein